MKHEPHSFTQKVGNFTVCSKCGLVALNNLFTDWCIKKGCYYDEHPEYKWVRVELVNRHQNK